MSGSTMHRAHSVQGLRIPKTKEDLTMRHGVTSMREPLLNTLPTTTLLSSLRGSWACVRTGLVRPMLYLAASCHLKLIACHD